MAAVILKYKVDNGNQYRVRGINYSGNGKVHTLGSIDGYMFISIPEETIDSYIPQPDSVDISIVSMNSAVFDDMCKWVHPAVNIDKQTRRSIREKYSIEDEFKALRTSDTEYSAFINDLIAAGKQKKMDILGFSGPSSDDS